VRLAEDLDRVLGGAVTIDDLELETLEAGHAIRVRATLRAATRVETIEAIGTDVLSVYGPFLQLAAESRLRDAFIRVVDAG